MWGGNTKEMPNTTNGFILICPTHAQPPTTPFNLSPTYTLQLPTHVTSSFLPFFSNNGSNLRWWAINFLHINKH
jgi:hypothetical protein